MLYQVIYIMWGLKKMFNIFKKKKEEKIIWWSVVEGLIDVEPIVPAKYALPDWWKRVQKITGPRVNQKGSIANCPSFPEFMSSGYVVKLWCDLYLDIKNDGEWKWRSPSEMFQFDSHPDVQFRDFIPQHMKDNTSLVLKPNCPWRVKTPPGWSVMQLPMTYHYNPIFEVLPGVIWSDIHHEINQQMLIKKYGEFIIPKGTPLAMYIPFKREKLDYEIQSPNDENMGWARRAFLHVNSSFGGGYQKSQAHQRQRLQGKCPFHKE